MNETAITGHRFASLIRFPAAAWFITCLIVTALAYIPVFHNGFVSWDDGIYITENSLIHSFTGSNLWQIISRSFEGHYHPFTLLSLMFDYGINGPDPLVFHLHNLLLHLCNTLLVFTIIRKLTGQHHTAGIAALLFALHPLHVEAVAWATARKDVLFTAWFLLSMWCYLRYLAQNQKKWLLLSLVAALVSSLSKGQGVFLPFCLLLTDYFTGRKLTDLKIWREKLPFFLPLMLMGVIALLAQRETGYLGEQPESAGLWQTLLTASGALAMYFYKMIVPLQLSAYYPLPRDIMTVNLSAMAGLLIAALLVWLLIRSFRRWPVVFFGLAFFLVNIFIFLRWIPVSNYLTADRYTYLASFGLFFIAGHAFHLLNQRCRMAFILPLLILPVLGWLTYERVKVWKDSMSLVSDILEHHPDVYPALNIRGRELQLAGNRTAALEDFNRALALQPANPRALANRAALYQELGRTADALTDLNEALKLDPGQYRAMNNRGLLLLAAGENDRALADFNRVIALAPGFAEAYNNRGMVYAAAGEHDAACAEFSKAIERAPAMAKAWANRGKCRNKTGDPGEAIRDLEQSLSLGLKTPLQYFELGFSWYLLQDFYKARKNFDHCLSMSPGDPNALAYRGYAHYNAGDFIPAVEDLTKALQSDSLNALAWGMRGLANMRINRKNEGCSDLEKALSLGLKQAQKELEKYCR
ncbi:MAG TPA: tetratricopeptide repeat protein [Bacteroidales bacterium]|nr:tetratricopeptide repeat protein [Bacteroidales bacterium]HSA44355.1 tetratricopeptide repeat protein [Bacteroidales bacterium]